MAKAARVIPKKKSAKKEAEQTPVRTVHVAMLIDRSGSMASIRSDVIGGINSFLHDQQSQPGTATLTIAQFDGMGFDVVVDAMDIHDVRDATEADFQPRGNTPLYDSIAKLVTHASARSVSHPDEDIIVCILTDGYENASREYTADGVKALITAKEAAGWVFTYLGANQDSFLAAQAIGVSVAATQNFIPDPHGTHAAYQTYSGSVTNARLRSAAGQSVASADFFSDNQQAQEDWAARSQKPDPNHWSANLPKGKKPEEKPNSGWSKSGA